MAKTQKQSQRSISSVSRSNGAQVKTSNSPIIKREAAVTADSVPVPITVPGLRERKVANGGAPIAALTCYDYSMARLLDRAGLDLLLVGDSLGTVVQGHQTTIPVTLDEMIYHCRCVTRGTKRALVVGDLPFLSYQASVEQAVLSAGRMLKEGGVGAVKLEGGIAVAPQIARIAAVDIPVVGHVGLTPQSYFRMGGHKKQGRKKGGIDVPGSEQRVLADARAVQDAGAFAVVLEGIPAELAAKITAELEIPTIGIGAGSACDGQILVVNDMLGIDPTFKPSFVRRFAELGEVIVGAAMEYVSSINDPAESSGKSAVQQPNSQFDGVLV